MCNSSSLNKSSGREGECGATTPPPVIQPRTGVTKEKVLENKTERIERQPQSRPNEVESEYKELRAAVKDVTIGWECAGVCFSERTRSFKRTLVRTDDVSSAVQLPIKAAGQLSETPSSSSSDDDDDETWDTLLEDKSDTQRIYRRPAPNQKDFDKSVATEMKDEKR